MKINIFNCVRCGLCCSNSGEEISENNEKTNAIKRDVLLYPEETDIIDMMGELKKIKIGFKEETIFPDIKNKQIIVVRYKLMLNENGNCPFLKENKCSIYDQRPLWCRAFPLKIEGLDTNSPEIKIENLCQSLKDIQRISSQDFNLDDLKRFFPLEFRQINQIFSREKKILSILSRMEENGEIEIENNLSFEEFENAVKNWKRYPVYSENV